MTAPSVWLRALYMLGLIGMLLGAIDPLEGSIVILLGAGLVALVALVAKSRYRATLYTSLALVALGVVALFVLSWFGGVGGDTGRSIWWLLMALPYPVGWILGLIGAVLALIEEFRHHAPPARATP